MSFFGLTQLGEQRPFHASSRHGLDLSLFVLKDFQVAFDRTFGMEADCLPLDALPKYLEKLYEGPLVGEEDEALIQQILENHGVIGQYVRREDLIEAVVRAKEIESDPNFWGEKEYKAAEHSSNASLREACKRNERLKYGPKDKFLNPLTAAQEVGWHIGDTKFAKMDRECTKRFPKTSSEISRFADAAFNDVL